METKEKRGLFGSDLKIIAIVAMFIDHFAAAFLQNVYYKMLPSDLYAMSNLDRMAWFKEHIGVTVFQYVILFMRGIGRFGFPLFAFLLVEGFIHTRDAKKYALRLGIFALISEIPFNLAFANVAFYEQYQNVFFTLTLSIVALIFIKHFEDKDMQGCKPVCTVLGIIGLIVTGAFLFKHSLFAALYSAVKINAVKIVIPAAVGVVTAFAALAIVSKKDAEKKNKFMITMFILAIFIVLADGLMTDYGGWGVFTVILMYLLRNNRVLAFTMGTLGLTIMSPLEAFAFIMVPVVAKYNGKRGISLKYFFYAFYPVHLGLLYLLAYLCGCAYFYWH